MSTVTDTKLNEVLALVQSMDSDQVNAVDKAINDAQLARGNP